MLYALVSDHVVAKPDLDDFMLGDRRSDDIQKVSECRETDSLEVLT